MTVSKLDCDRILVVDDAVSRRQGLCALLQDMGILRVEHAGDAAATLSALSHDQFDAVLLSSSAGFDPIALARRIRAAGPDPYVPVILVAEQVDAQLALSASDSGVTEFLARPLTSGTIARCLVRAAARRIGTHTRQPSSAIPSHPVPVCST